MGVFQSPRVYIKTETLPSTTKTLPQPRSLKKQFLPTFFYFSPQKLQQGFFHRSNNATKIKLQVKIWHFLLFSSEGAKILPPIHENLKPFPPLGGGNK